MPSRKTSQPKTSPRKTAANQANAKKSTGPQTPEGKAACRNNAYKHGMYSRNPVGPAEDRATYDALCRQVRDNYAAVLNDSNDDLAQALADARWRLDRLKGIEAALFSADDIDTAEIDCITRWIVRAENAYFKAYTKLHALQKEAAAAARAAAKNQPKDANPAQPDPDAPPAEPVKPVLYWRDLKTGEPVLAPGFTEDGPIDYRKPENRPPGYGT